MSSFPRASVINSAARERGQRFRVRVDGHIRHAHVQPFELGTTLLPLVGERHMAVLDGELAQLQRQPLALFG